MYNYTLSELRRLETIDQSWDGAELKIDDGEIRVWLVPRENRGYDGDYQIETRNSVGRWITKNYYFNH